MVITQYNSLIIIHQTTEYSVVITTRPITIKGLW